LSPTLAAATRFAERGIVTRHGTAHKLATIQQRRIKQAGADMDNKCDFLVIGAGIAGASAAYELSVHGSVIVLEREDQPGYHSTGRSAAVFTEAYGNASIRGLTVSSRAFFEAPPGGFCDTPILSPRGVVFIGREDQQASLEAIYEETRGLVPDARRIDAAEVLHRVPFLRPDYVGAGVLEPDAMDIDVNALHQGYLRGLRSRGGKIVTDADVTGLTRTTEGWSIETRAGTFAAPVVINAAGAWCDVIGQMAGCRPLGLVPKRRTAFIFDAPDGVQVDDCALVVDADEKFYFKPDSGRLLGSPADETPVEPCDVQPEELDIAVAADRIMKATSVDIRHIRNKWAGLRSFVADKTLVAGFDPVQDGFFWLAGQGGYGIQTSPAMATLSAALITGQRFPEYIADRGVSAAKLDPARFSV